MRLILVRHGESASNRAEDARLLAERRGTNSAAEPETGKGSNGDTYLTENGHAQVEAFGRYWAPILRDAASKGKLRVVCSPMRRNLQTAAPLLRELAHLGAPVTATVRWGNFECMGIVHPADSHIREKLADLADDHTGQTALLKETRWTPAGQSPKEMVDEFPHIDTSELPGRVDVGWYSAGPEDSKAMLRRFKEMADWVEELRDSTDPNDIVLCVTHGDMQNRLLNILLARHMGLPDLKPGPAPAGSYDTFAAAQTYVAMDPGSNTSVTMVTLNTPGTTQGDGIAAPGFQIEFMHRLDHLGPDTEPDTLVRKIYTLELPKLLHWS